MTDTIFALSSGAPPAAIAVVRVSGPEAHTALERLADRLPPVRRMVLSDIRDHAGERLDRALVVRFSGEGSVTGEKLAELHLHGGRATVDAVMAALGRLPGLRPARAGEFTWRAFRNGRMDLIEVESLSNLLRAETQSQRRAAIAGEGLSGFVETCRTRLLQLSALVEAALDQSDEDDVPADTGAAARLARTLSDDLGAMLDRPGAERLFDGVRAVFAGPPNAGKSSLINAIAQRDVAIVSAQPGTTRDAIEAAVTLGGVPFILTDTAGLRKEADSDIEREGIARAGRRMTDADMIVWMDEQSEPPLVDARVLRVFPRSDAGDRVGVVTTFPKVSALTGEGISDLIAAMIRVSRDVLPVEGDVALTRRQRRHLTECRLLITAFHGERDHLIAAEHLRLARRELDDLTGRSSTEDMLDTLFGTFCIGK